jgi:UDP-GlcNAc:undecaprenyl-phosphate GlcNAc-1-phosphate transferase
MPIKYILLFASAFFVCLFLIPRFIKKAVKQDVVDKPSLRKVHRRIVPLWGGIPIYLSFAAVVVLLYLGSLLVNGNFSQVLSMNDGFLGSRLAGLLIGGAILIWVGAVDDRRGVPPKLKLLGQVAGALAVISFGVRMPGFNVPFFNYYVSLPLAVSVVLTLIWMVALINAMNFIDGLDGLAAGIALISTVSFFLISMYKPPVGELHMAQKVSYFISIIAVIFAGSLFSFLFFNFPPAKVFMGDGGSMFLGLMLASISIIGSYKGVTAFTLFTPVLVISVPIFDIVFAVVRRMQMGVPISKADKSHLHHRLLALGLSPLQAVIILWLAAIAVNAVVFLLS